MDPILSYFHSQSLDIALFVRASGILLAVLLGLALTGRFVFGKRSVLCLAVSSAIGILFIYAITIVCGASGEDLQRFVAPLPFINISGEHLSLFSFTGAHYTVICSEILSMIILAFLVNLADSWFPKGKNIFGWIILRCLTVAIAYFLHLLVVWLFATFLPQGLVTYAPTVLLALLILMILTGALKIVIGALRWTVDPIIGGLYTFFFATIIGKQIPRAVLTTALLAGLVLLLQYIGIATISIASAALAAYIPFLILLVIIWYLANQIL